MSKATINCDEGCSLETTVIKAAVNTVKRLQFAMLKVSVNCDVGCILELTAMQLQLTVLKAAVNCDGAAGWS